MKREIDQCFGGLNKRLRRLPKVYLAGKIRKNCWRHDLVSGLRDHHWDFGPLKQATFIYVGPFFVSCDHGCYHGRNSHGKVAGCWPDRDSDQRMVARLCRDAVHSADLVFCYIDAPDCYGTIAEIERANVLGIPVVIAFAPGIACAKDNDFWFACTSAYDVYYNVYKCELAALLQYAVKGLKW